MRNLTEEFEVQTNWDPWNRMTGEECTHKIKKFTKDAKRVCDDWIEFAFNDPLGCGIFVCCIPMQELGLRMR